MMVFGTQKIIVLQNPAYRSFLDSMFLLLKAPNQTSPSVITLPKDNYVIRRASFLEDEETLVLLMQARPPMDNFKFTLNFFTFKDSSILSLELPRPDTHSGYEMTISHNNEIVFLTGSFLVIYNISDPKLPILESSSTLYIGSSFPPIVSRDDKTLFILGVAYTTQPYILIWNVSDIKAPQLLGSMEIQGNAEYAYKMELSHDEKMLFLMYSYGMLMIDVRVPTHPTVFGFSHFLNEQHWLKLAHDQSLFYTTSVSGVSVFDITSQYMIHMKQQDFKVGGSYSVILKALKMNKDLKFDFLTKKHKIYKASLFGEYRYQSKTYSHPSWPLFMTFEKERSLLTIEPRSPSSVGTYKIAVTLATQVQPSTFVGPQLFSSEHEAKDLMLDLLLRGHVDSQGYIAENIDFTQELWLDPKYETMKREIRAILSTNYIQAIGEISVSSSLKLFEEKPLRIETPSKGTISVRIRLCQKASFVTKSYTYIKSHISTVKSFNADDVDPLFVLNLEGPLDYMNDALKEIVIDGPSVCFVDFSITDGMNPPAKFHQFLLSKFVNLNKQPVYNSSSFPLQQQIDSRPFYTASYSAIEIDKNTFKDENNLTLEYSLEMQETGKQVPSWISLKGLTLMATPPENHSPLPYKFVLVAKNEFKNITVPFTLRVNIPFTYAIKLASAYVGYLVSFIGFIFTLNKIYNFIARKYYRYPRSYKLKLGEEITDEKIFPISFITEEIKESKIIYDQLEALIIFDEKSQLLDYFIDSETQSLYKDRILATLQRLQNKYYDSTDKISRGIIQQLVINKVVNKQLASKNERKTRDLFHKIKNQWMDLVTLASSPFQFMINSEKLEMELSKLTSKEDESDMDNRPLFAKGYNLDLLGNAINAHAFNFQNIDIDEIRIDVVSHKKLKGKSLYLLIRRFLQKDIKPFVFLNKREIGYGIEYVVKKNTLHFIGKLIYDLKDDTIVIHLKNNRGRILREIWLTGESQKTLELSQIIIEDVSETL